MRTRTLWTMAAVILLIAETLIWKATAADLRVEPIQPSTDTHVLPLPESINTPTPVSSDELSTQKPVTIFGLYNCRGWVGVIIVLENGTVVGPLSMRPADAQAFAKKAGIPAEHQQHLFPAQGECSRVSPYEDQLRNQDTSTT